MSDYRSSQNFFDASKQNRLIRSVCQNEGFVVIIEDQQGYILPQGFDLIADGVIYLLLCARPLDGLGGATERQQQVTAMTECILR